MNTIWATARISAGAGRSRSSELTSTCSVPATEPGAEQAQARRQRGAEPVLVLLVVGALEELLQRRGRRRRRRCAAPARSSALAVVAARRRGTRGSIRPPRRPPGVTGSSRPGRPAGSRAARCRAGSSTPRRAERHGERERASQAERRVMRDRRRPARRPARGSAACSWAGSSITKRAPGRAVEAVLDPHPAAVDAHVLVDEGEAEPGALAAAAAPRRRAAGEALEDRAPAPRPARPGRGPRRRSGRG